MTIFPIQDETFVAFSLFAANQVSLSGAQEEIAEREKRNQGNCKRNLSENGKPAGI
jgi:hypothetical protein